MDNENLIRLYLIRHGRQNSRLCNIDVGLSKEGIRQASLLGERLSNIKIDAVYSSDMLRAVETAKEACRFWRGNSIIKPGLREMSFGDLEGRTEQEIAQFFTSFMQKRDQMEDDISYPGGEGTLDVWNRAFPVLQEIVSSGVQRVAVVTHGGVIRVLVAYLLGMDLFRYRLLAQDLENCSITELIYQKDKNRFLLQRFNDYAHLEPFPLLLRDGWEKKD